LTWNLIVWHCDGIGNLTVRPKRPKRVFRIIDVDDTRFPFGLVDPSDEVVRIDVKPEWLADHALQELRADTVLHEDRVFGQIPDSKEEE
jgi:hypothetical protein